jgi:prepilin-type N-terminal cleavage/methylation domain-containing protein
MSARSGARPGFSLVEMLIAFVVFAVIFGAAVTIMGEEIRTFAAANSSTTAVQNGRFAIDQLGRSFRAAGIGLGQGQPMLVYGDSSTVVVNGDYAANDRANLDAIFIDTLVSDAASTALGKAGRMRVPGTAFYYPDTTYRWGATGTAPAETIIIFFRPDSTTPRTDDYILFRQVNGQAPEEVARDLQHNGRAAFFQYWQEIDPDTAPAYLDTIRLASLPIAHTNPMHLSQGDTMPFALIDRVRAVRVSFVAANGAPAGKREVKLAVTRLLRLPNAGEQAFATCGNAPVAPGAFNVGLAVVNGVTVPELTWTPSGDEGGGEHDVYRYVIYRVEGPFVAFGDPYINIPSGSANYLFDDSKVESGKQYTYTVAAQDCTPQVGASAGAESVNVP